MNERGSATQYTDNPTSIQQKQLSFVESETESERTDDDDDDDDGNVTPTADATLSSDFDFKTALSQNSSNSYHNTM